MSKVIITQELFDKMNYDTVSNNIPSDSTGADNENKTPSVLIVFRNSDINAALYHLYKSLQSPFKPNAIATLLVQESIKQDFVDKLCHQFKTYSANKIQSNEYFVKTLEIAKKRNAHIITVETSENNGYQPTLVCDFTHEHLGASSASGIVTLHTFRTAKEAITLVNRESLKFPNVSIWHENHSYAYELVAALKSEHFFINCYQAPLNILEENIKQGKNYVILENGYHYETFKHDGIQKSVVFPFGSIFAN